TRAVERPVEMDLDHPAPLGVIHPAGHAERAPRPAEHRNRRLLGLLPQSRAQFPDASIIRENIDRAPFRQRARETAIDLPALGDVGRYRDRVTPGTADF